MKTHKRHDRTGALAKSLAFAAGAIVLALQAPAGAAIVDESGEAVAKLAPTKDSTASGTATFSAAGKDGVRVTIEVSGLKPNSQHGLHVHEKGDCSAPDATSAGPHFSLQGQQHGIRVGLGARAGLFCEPGTETAGEDDDLHTILGSGMGTMKRPPRRRYSSCWRMISSAKFQARTST